MKTREECLAKLEAFRTTDWFATSQVMLYMMALELAYALQERLSPPEITADERMRRELYGEK